MGASAMQLFPDGDIYYAVVSAGVSQFISQKLQLMRVIIEETSTLRQLESMQLLQDAKQSR
jgi:hypothetical protein